MGRSKVAEADFTYDSGRHVYKYGSLILPSVTQVLPEKFHGVPPELIATAAWRGDQVHDLTAKYDLAGTLPKVVTDDIAPFLDAYLLFLKDRQPEILAVELRGWCKRHLYAGTLDRIYKWGRGNDLVDIKTTAVIDPEAGIQTAGYEPISGFKIDRRFTLQLKANGKYELHEWKEKTDFGVFLSYLNCYRWRMRHRPPSVKPIKELLPDV